MIKKRMKLLPESGIDEKHRRHDSPRSRTIRQEKFTERLYLRFFSTEAIPASGLFQLRLRL
jgi:hypothetical protein